MTAGAIGMVGLPALEISVGEAPLSPEHFPSLTRLRVHQRLGAPAQCELQFSSPHPSLAERLALGASLRVWAGGSLFGGEITAVEFSHRAHGTLDLKVRAYDALHRLRGRQPVRAHLEQSAADLARELTADLGLMVDAPREGPVWRHLIQHRQSDLELLVDLAARAGLHLSLSEGVLRLLPLAGQGPPLPLAWGAQLLEADVELNAAKACELVQTAGWNVREVEPLEGEARAPRFDGAPGPVASGALLGSRALMDERAEERAHLEGAAQGELERRVASQAVVRGVARGDARLQPGTRVEIAGLHARACGIYALTECIHHIDPERGYLTRLSSEPPERRPAPAAATASLGVVAVVDGSSGRVKVRLPAHGDVETDWLQVATLGAGQGKGLTFLPDLGDVVVLLMAHEDASQAIVVGSVYGHPGPPDSGVEGGRVQRFTLHTRAGHHISLDEERKAMHLEDAQGNSIDLSPAGFLINAKGPLTLDAAGQPIVIRGARVDFRKG